MDENHFFVGQELSGDDLDFTGSGDHPVDAGLREGIKLLVLPGGVISKGKGYAQDMLVAYLATSMDPRRR